MRLEEVEIDLEMRRLLMFPKDSEKSSPGNGMGGRSCGGETVDGFASPVSWGCRSTESPSSVERDIRGILSLGLSLGSLCADCSAVDTGRSEDIGELGRDIDDFICAP